jgi:hypothetical protein
MKQWYEELFENYGIKYDEETFAQEELNRCAVDYARFPSLGWNSLSSSLISC